MFTKPLTPEPELDLHVWSVDALRMMTAHPHGSCSSPFLLGPVSHLLGSFELLRQGLCHQATSLAPLAYFSETGWSWTPDSPASTFWVLRLEVWTPPVLSILSSVSADITEIRYNLAWSSIFKGEKIYNLHLNFLIVQNLYNCMYWKWFCSDSSLFCLNRSFCNTDWIPCVTHFHLLVLTWVTILEFLKRFYIQRVQKFYCCIIQSCVAQTTVITLMYIYTILSLHQSLDKSK